MVLSRKNRTPIFSPHKIRNRKFLRARRDGQDLAAFVKAARRTDAVRNVGFGALRTFANLRQGHHAVVSTAHFHAARRRFTFWDAHKINSITVSVCSVQSTRTVSVLLRPRFSWTCRFSASIRRNPVCTMDASETQGEYLPA